MKKTDFFLNIKPGIVRLKEQHILFEKRTFMKSAYLTLINIQISLR